MNIKVYLDTSVINFLFADDPPEKKEITIDFLRILSGLKKRVISKKLTSKTV